MMPSNVRFFQMSQTYILNKGKYYFQVLTQLGKVTKIKKRNQNNQYLFIFFLKA